MDTAFALYLHRVRTKRKPLAEETIQQHLDRVDYFCRIMNPITKEGFHEFIAQKLKSGTSHGTINKYVQTIKHYGRFKQFDWVEDEKQLAEVPTIPERLSNEELEKFLAVEKRPLQTEENYEKWQLFWHVAFFCGLRLKEIRTLTKDNVDLGNKLLVLRKTKTDPRLAAVITQVVHLLEKRLTLLKGNYLFPTPHSDHEPMGERSYIGDWKARIKTIGIQRHVKPYDARHTAITRWIEDMKLNIFDVKRMAGHREISTTERYYAFAGYGNVRKQLETDPYFKKDDTALTKLTNAVKEFREHHFEEDARFDYPVIEKALALMYESIKN